ncbi:carbohydrate esterase family 9 protein [Marasmius fiardii PR-910]|nr:carbohydrate esterase family 9 protein [Marasmius fiardii PR-910]
MFDDDKGQLPTHHASSTHSQRRGRRPFAFISLIVLAAILYLLTWREWSTGTEANYVYLPRNAQTIVDKCSNLRVKPSPPPDFYNREVSDRFDASLAPKNPVLIRNATIWTGEVGAGLEVVFGDVLFHKGIVKRVGKVGDVEVEGEAEEINVNGAWVTAGIVDLHTHLGVFSLPSLSGSSDTNSHAGLTQPWLRSLDALNTHDEAYRLAVAGGVTSAVVLPGSNGAIGGQAFPIKLRPTSEKSSSSMLLESPFDAPTHWRHLKQACGENPSRAYSGTRMDTIWSFRAAYEEARKLKEKQDDFCERVERGRWDLLNAESFPEDLKWEALVDVLRGKVKVHNHCYEAVDLDGIVRLSNEFNFSIAGFHHASEAYLVPDLLKKTYGRTPVIAMWATNARFKRESYRGSEYAPKVLSDSGFEVVMKSDHPVLNSRYVLHEAQQAHYYGLPAHLALASITTTPAKAVGLDHRVGKVKSGYDADLIIWDSHPLALGSTPRQVFIDGIPQIHHVPSKPLRPHHPKLNMTIYPDPWKPQTAPATPSFNEETQAAVAFDGLPPLEAKKELKGTVVFSNAKSVYLRVDGKVVDVLKRTGPHPVPPQPTRSVGEVVNRREGAKVVVRDGEIICIGVPAGVDFDLGETGFRICEINDLRVDVDIDLEGGSVAPGLSSFGAPLGLQHIDGEISTGDGSGKVDTRDGIARAVDGILFRTRDALLSYRSGVTTGITPPFKSPGLGTAFGTGAEHKLQPGAVVVEDTALHVALSMNSQETVSSQVRGLRNSLVGAVNGDSGGEVGKAFKRVIEGEIPLVVMVQNADIMASLIKLKKEVEGLLTTKNDSRIRVTFAGAAEAHLLASEIGQAGVGVVVAPTRPLPYTWEHLRILPGPPLSEKTAVQTLLEQNVTVGIGVFSGAGAWISRNVRWDAGWIALDSQGTISNGKALELASTNLDVLLGLDVGENDKWGDYVATKGGELLEFEGKVLGVVSRRKGVVDLF